MAPGNAGIAAIAECATFDVEDGAAVINFVQENAIDFVIIGPEAPLAAGVADRLRDAGILVFGPSKDAAQLESSKRFTKEVCTAAEMAKRGMPYQGILYAGLMIKDGKARLVEYNVRFGDPECQVLMMRLGAQALDLLQAAAEGRLNEAQVNWADDYAITVVMSANGYPGSYEKGTAIGGLDNLPEDSSNMVFHAGTADNNGQIVATGGRVLNVTARGASLAEARDRAYAMVDGIDWPDGFCRRDIGWRAL